MVSFHRAVMSLNDTECITRLRLLDSPRICRARVITDVMTPMTPVIAISEIIRTALISNPRLQGRNPGQIFDLNSTRKGDALHSTSRRAC